MSQINVNPGRDDVADASGDRTAAAGINLITVLIVLAVLAVVLWYLFTGPLHVGSSGGTTNINVTNPAPTVNVNPTSPPSAPAPSNSGGASTNTGGSSSTSGGTTTNPPPANP